MRIKFVAQDTSLPFHQPAMAQTGVANAQFSFRFRRDRDAKVPTVEERNERRKFGARRHGLLDHYSVRLQGREFESHLTKTCSRHGETHPWLDPVAISPYRPALVPYIVASARDRCDARKEALISQGGQNES